MEHFTLLRDSVVSNSFDIFTISETWLDSSVNNESIHIPGYTLYRQDRGPHKPGGGLCVYIKKNYKVSSLENVSSVSDNNFQQLWLKVQSRCYKSFVICTVYRPPSTPLNFMDDLANSLIESPCQVLMSLYWATSIATSFKITQILLKKPGTYLYIMDLT